MDAAVSSDCRSIASSNNNMIDKSITGEESEMEWRAGSFIIISSGCTTTTAGIQPTEYGRVRLSSEDSVSL